MYSKKIRNFILKNRKTMLFMSFSLFLLFPDYAFAEGDDNVILDILNAFVKIATLLLGVITNFIGWFMTPSWTNGSAIGINTHLKDLWIMMSNVVYLIFAFILIWIALMNILGKGGDWELKQALPRFIGGVLIVPFSWFIVGAMISLSSILSVSVLTLPQDSFPEYESILDEEPICTTYKLNLASGDSGKPPMECVKGSEKTINEYLKDSNNVFGIINTYTYSIMHIDSNGKLFSDDILKGVKNIFDISVKGIVDIIFVLVYFILMVALLMALFVRGVYIWVFMVVSPLFGLMFFFKDKGSDAFKNFTLSKFIGLALMPVYVSAALSFGLLFIMVAGNNIIASDCKGNPDRLCSTYEDKPKIEFLGFTLILEGGTFGSASDPNRDTNFKGSLAQIIMQIFGVAVLRIAVMAALGSTEITKEVIAPIKSFGDSVGQLAMKAPTYAPIIPAPGGGRMSARSLGTMGSDLQSRIDGSFTKKGLDASQNLFGGNDLVNEMNRSMAGINRNTDPQLRANKLKEIFDKGMKSKDSSEISKFKESLITLGLKKDKADIIVTKSSMQKGNESTLAKNIFSNFEKGIMNKAGFQDYNQLKVYIEKLNNTKSTSASTPDNSTSSGTSSSGKKFEEYKKGYNIKEINSNTKIEFVNGKDEKDGNIKIILNNEGNAEEYSFDFNGSALKNDKYKNFIGEDKKVAKKMLDIIGDDLFKKVLEKMEYEKSDELYKNIKSGSTNS